MYQEPIRSLQFYCACAADLRIVKLAMTYAPNHTD